VVVIFRTAILDIYIGFRLEFLGHNGGGSEG
jgi:hypothetical protein